MWHLRIFEKIFFRKDFGQKMSKKLDFSIFFYKILFSSNFWKYACFGVFWAKHLFWLKWAKNGPKAGQKIYLFFMRVRDSFLVCENFIREIFETLTKQNVHCRNNKENWTKSSAKISPLEIYIISLPSAKSAKIYMFKLVFL